MRGHKYSLVWLGCSTAELSRKRATYIGAERIAGQGGPILPESSERTIPAPTELDSTRARILRRYFSERAQSISELSRVLRSGRAAVLVVGTSTMRGLDV
ncbi:MAG: hypothetical protein VB961_07815 [Dehalococcoidia bacterium]